MGIKYGREGLALAKEIDFARGIGSCYNQLGVNYAGGLSDFDKALEMYKKSMKIYKELNYNSGVAAALNNIGLIYQIQVTV